MNSYDGFTGVFDGGRKAILGLYIEENKDYVGLFNKNSGVIQGVTIINGYIHGLGSVGGICGFNAGGNIIECINKRRNKENEILIG